MPEFLELLPPAEALKRWLDSIAPGPLGVERIAAQDALDRVTAEAIYSPEALPAFPRSTVDGYAVRAADTHGASDSLPAYFQVSGEVPMGGQPDFQVLPGTAALIHTGGMLPQGADAVVMLENTQASRPGEIEVLRAVAAAENILQAGEDVQTGQVVLPAGCWLRPSEIGGLMALGILDIPAAKKPRVGILSSGDEVIPPEQAPVPGQVRDINSYALSALVQRAGGIAERLGIVPDRAEALRVRVRRALDTCDLVVITAGSSASTRDLTARVLDEMGEPGVLVHGVNVRPGKPTILAACDGKAAVGLPGNPVSALVIAGLFVVPLIQRLLGIPADRPEAVAQARLTVNLSSQAGREDWVPVKLIGSAQGLLAEPIFYKSNLIFSLARADGLLKIPADANGLAAGELATVKWL